MRYRHNLREPEKLKIVDWRPNLATVEPHPIDSQQPQPQPGSPSAIKVADILLSSAIVNRATGIWIEPLPPDEHQDAHRVAVERGRKVVSSAVLGGGLGDAVIARFAVLGGLDVLDRRPQTGRLQVFDGDKEYDVFVTTRVGEHGVWAEVRVVLDEDTFTATENSQGAELPTVLTEGTTIGPYRIKSFLGQGGMGIVYRAEHTLLKKESAIKVLRAEVLKNDPDSARRFFREARAAARIKSDAIVNVVDFGNLSDGRPYLVMDLLEGDSLEDIIKQGPAPVERAVEMIRKVAKALHAAHSAGVVHRDLTPSNVFVVGEGEDEAVKLVDFGAAHLAEPDLENIPDGPEGFVLGTPYYMPPEQARGLETDERSDIYSLGVVFFELLSGRPPFDGKSVRTIVRHHVFTDPPLPTSPLESLPVEIERIVSRCLRKAPEERYQTASELAEDLGRAGRVSNRSGWRKWLPS